jgi:hypothetical protein
MKTPLPHRYPQPASKDTATSNPAFLETIEYRRFVEFCDACRHFRYIGLCYGPPGIGKTLSALRYSRAEKIVAHDRWTSETTDDLPIDTLFYTTSVVNTPSQVSQDLHMARERLMSIVLDPIRREGTAVLEKLRIKDEKRRKEILDNPNFKSQDWPSVDPIYVDTFKASRLKSGQWLIRRL